MKFFIASPWKNKDAVKTLSDGLINRGYHVYSFLESGANLSTGLSIADELKTFAEAVGNWQSDPRIKHIFDSEIHGLSDSDTIILLGPAGHSSLLEAGIGYGMGKNVVMIGAIEKPEAFYLICERFYPDIPAFLNDVANFATATSATPPNPGT